MTNLEPLGLNLDVLLPWLRNLLTLPAGYRDRTWQTWASTCLAAPHCGSHAILHSVPPRGHLKWKKYSTSTVTPKPTGNCFYLCRDTSPTSCVSCSIGRCQSLVGKGICHRPCTLSWHLQGWMASQQGADPWSQVEWCLRALDANDGRHQLGESWSPCL